MDELVEQVRHEAVKTGREPREILESMRDEGLIELDDEAFEIIASRASWR